MHQLCTNSLTKEATGCKTDGTSSLIVSQHGEEVPYLVPLSPNSKSITESKTPKKILHEIWPKPDNLLQFQNSDL